MAGAYDDIWRDGVFAKDSNLKEFLVSGPAVAAALQIQNSFEMKYTRADCEKMIEDYACWGGDGGLTEATMREACGMPQRDVRGVDTRAASVIIVDNDPQDVPAYMAWWQKVSEILVLQLLQQDRLDISEPMMKRMNWKGLVKDLPNISKEELLNTLQSKKAVIKSRPRGKTGEVFVPGLSSSVSLESLLQHLDRSSCPVLPERLALDEFSEYVSKCPSRAANARILAKVHHSLSNRAAKAGRQPTAAKTNKEYHAEKAAKILAHESICEALLEQLKNPPPVASQSPARKRVRSKGPDLEAPACASSSHPHIKQEKVKQEEGEKFMARKFIFVESKYEYPSTTTLRTRKIVQGLAGQKLTRRAQIALLADTHDLDISNSVFTLLSQLVTRLEISPEMPKALRAILEKCAQSRDEICVDVLRKSKTEGKQILTAVLYGGAVPEEFRSSELLRSLHKVSIYSRWLAISLLETEFERFRSADVNKKNPDMSILSHLYLAAEDCVLTAWTEYLLSLNPAHLSLHFDGVRVSPIEGHSIDALCKQSADHIKKQTGFDVVIREKVHRTVLQTIKHVAVQESVQRDAFWIQKMGNCIPSAIAALLGSESNIGEALAGEEATGVSTESRSYKECELLCKVKLVPCLRFSVLPPGAYLLHSEAGGQPHCVGLRLKDNDDLSCVHDAGCIYKLTRTQLADAIDSGIDGSTCVFFQVRQAAENNSFESSGLDAKEAAALLDLEASGHYKKPAARRSKAVAKPEKRKQPSPIKQSSAVSVSSPSEPEVVDVLSDSASEMEIECSEVDEDSQAAVVNWMDDHGLVLTDQTLLLDLAKEVSSMVEKQCFKKTAQGFACPCCPWRCFRTSGRVKEHLSKYRAEKNQYCCSGTKQLKCILSLHDSDMISGARCGNYLHRSSALLRDQVHPPLPSTNNSIDKNIRLVLDSGGALRCIFSLSRRCLCDVTSSTIT